MLLLISFGNEAPPKKSGCNGSLLVLFQISGPQSQSLSGFDFRSWDDMDIAGTNRHKLWGNMDGDKWSYVRRVLQLAVFLLY